MGTNMKNHKKIEIGSQVLILKGENKGLTAFVTKVDLSSGVETSCMLKSIYGDKLLNMYSVNFPLSFFEIQIGITPPKPKTGKATYFYSQKEENIHAEWSRKEGRSMVRNKVKGKRYTEVQTGLWEEHKSCFKDAIIVHVEENLPVFIHYGKEFSDISKISWMED